MFKVRLVWPKLFVTAAYWLSRLAVTLVRSGPLIVTPLVMIPEMVELQSRRVTVEVILVPGRQEAAAGDKAIVKALELGGGPMVKRFVSEAMPEGTLAVKELLVALTMI